MLFSLILLSLFNVVEGVIIWQLLNRILLMAKVERLSLTPLPTPLEKEKEVVRKRIASFPVMN